MRRLTVILALALPWATAALGQSGDGFDLHWATVDGGGGVRAGGTVVLQGTAGQPDSGMGTGDAFTFHGGFWAAFVEELPPLTATPSATESPTATAALTPPSPIATVTPSATLVGDVTSTPTASGTPTATVASPTPSPTATATPPLTIDPNCDGLLSAADLVALAAIIAGGERAPCLLDDVDGDGVVDELDIEATIEALFVNAAP